MPKSGLKALWILPLLGVPSAVFAQASFCNLENVVRRGSGVELHFVSGSNVFVRVMKAGQGVSPADRMYHEIDGQMHRLYAGEIQPESAPSEVILFESEEVFVGGASHSSCTVVAANEGHVLGVEMKASVSLPGTEPKVFSRFLPASAATSAGH